MHCHAGISRSATIVAAYLMIKRHMTAQEAIRVVRYNLKSFYLDLSAIKQFQLYSIIRTHRSIRPNSGFLQQLCDLNEALLGERRRARADMAALSSGSSLVGSSLAWDWLDILEKKRKKLHTPYYTHCEQNIEKKILIKASQLSTTFSSLLLIHN